MNRDGRVDLIVLAANVEILIGNGNGTFQAPTSVSLSNFSGFMAVSTGDFNRDGKLDLAIAASGPSRPEVAILLGKATGHSEQQSGTRPPVFPWDRKSQNGRSAQNNKDF